MSTEDKKHYWLYVLKQEHGKYYVGITARKNPQDRINQHFSGFYSAEWTKLYKPVEVTELIDIGNITNTEAKALERQRTLQYMKKYHYQNVRGAHLSYRGKYVKIGNLFWRDEDFKMLLGILTMMLAIALLLNRVY